MMNIKEFIKKNRIKQYEVANILKMSESEFSRLLRYPEKIGQEKLDKIYKAIEEIKSGC